MKLLLWHWGRRGAGPRFTLELARVLSAHPEHQILLSLSRQSELYELTRATGLQSFDIDTYSSFADFLRASAGLHRVIRRQAEFIQREQVDVVLVVMRHMWGPFAVGAMRHAGARIATIVHDATPHPSEAFPGWRWSFRREFAASDHLIALSDYVAEGLATYHRIAREKIVRLPHPVFTLQQHPPTPRSLPTTRRPRVMFFGRIRAYKGIELFLAAAAGLQSRHPLDVIIAGQGDLAPFTPELRRLSNLEIINRWIPEEELPLLFSSADLIVTPYTESSQSGVVSAAYAAGLPVVATPVGGLVEQVESGVTGLITDEVSADAVARAIEILLDQPALYARCSEGAVAYAKGRLSWPAFAGNLLKAIC